MNNKLIASLTLAGCFALAVPSRAADATATSAGSAAADPAAAIKSQVQAIVTKINAKIQKGLRNESDYSDELSAFDKLLAAHKGEKTDAVASAAYMKDLLYLQVFNEPEKGLAGFKQIAKDYPATATGQQIAKIIPQLEPQVQAMMATATIQKDLAVGKQFPEFAIPAGPVKDITGKPLSVAQYKGKIVLIDFWATWCGPCMAEMPNVIAAYDKYHSRGFDIIGVSLDQPADLATLPDFLKTNKMPWRQFCDGKYWSNELAVKYGIQSIPASYLLDGTGKIIAVSPRGPALAPAIEAALAANGKS